MATPTMEKFNWYCGVNSTVTLDNFTWDLTHTLYNTCFTDLVYTVPHLLFILLSILVLFISGCCTTLRHKKYDHLIPYPGHYLRWTVYILLMLQGVLALGESLLTVLNEPQDVPTRPHLYVPAVLALAASLLSLIYYHHVEVWNKPTMLWLLLLFWTTALGSEILRLLNYDEDADVDFTLMRALLNVSAIALYGVLLLLEINAIRCKVLKCCAQEEPFPEDLKRPDMYFMQGYCNFISMFTYSWLRWVFVKGYKKSLEFDDLGTLTEVHTAKYHRDRFNRAFKMEQKRAEANNTSISLLRIYTRAYAREMVPGFLCMLLGNTVMFAPPFIVAAIINYVTRLSDAQAFVTKYVPATDFFSNGFVLVVLLFLVLATRGIALHGNYHLVIQASVHVQSALQAAVYDKSLRLSSYTMTGGAMTQGQITNHMSVDAINVLDAFQMICYALIVPYQCVGYLIILYYQLGVSALIGFCMVLVIVPMQSVIAKKAGVFQKQALERSDERLKRTNELLQGIKLIKLYGWEDMFYDAISKVRTREIIALAKQMGTNVFLVTLSTACPILLTLVSYSLYTKLTGLPLTPAVAFSSLAAFNQLLLPIFILPFVLMTTINGVVSTRRLKVFLAAPEIEDIIDNQPTIKNEVEVRQPRHKVYINKKPEDRRRLLSNQDHVDITATPPSRLPADVACQINGSFSWNETASAPTLPNIQLDIPAGKLTMVIGQVGSGKSSLLAAILGEMTTVSGGVQWNEKCSTIAYGAQKAWLLNTSLKENILFGTECQDSRYKKVIAACSLQPDIDILPGGDQTEIGEKGINMSGGQKQRVSVGRALYSYNDVVILDDPLSALDMHVGAHLFKEGIEGFLMRKSKRTVILVTHQTQYAEKADKIIYMKDGRIENQGNLEEIREANPELAASWISAVSTSRPDSDSEMSATEERAELLRQISVHEKEEMMTTDNKTEEGRLVQDEEREKGSVSWRVYLSYISAIGYFAFLLLCLFAVIQNGLQIWTNLWLSQWSQAGEDSANNNTEKPPLQYYLIGYAGLSVSSIVTGTISTGIIFMFSLLAGRRLHNSMLKTIMHAPMRFFDTTPIGRILNRFSSDTKVIDQLLGNTLKGFVNYWLACIGAIVVNAVVTWYFAVTLIPFIFIYFLIMHYFLRTSRELQRLTNISKSPVYAHFSETLGGLSTIRAYKQQERFRTGLIQKIEKNNIMFMYLNTSNRWLGVRLELIGAFIVLLAGLSTMIAAAQGLLLPSLVGLAISYALSASGQLNWMLRATADLEMQLNSIERVQYYRNVETEKYRGALTPNPNWPERGEIVYDGVSARYDTELDPVLQNIHVRIQPAEKIGICGRTGSGKSSLTLTLFRIIQTYKGSISIDGINIANVPLVELRGRLAIIPQDPVLFIGTVRYNLDARGEHDDDALWEALEIAQLKGLVSELDLKLDAMVTEGGENFSVGQRQLFCLARAFLRKTRILVMDEATASIDLETDSILQAVVATAFKDRTVLTIAHRVQTILDSDRILVLNEGRIAEFDTPDALLTQEDSIFTSLVNAGT
ncbi:ATP-binding cassette sub-family C member 8-like [Asterias rubens]|uniref:ATP-binding cassette sub-family C member 8-like n=1 Tax=Asterias rubens TaxID=7604 RepID=UPI0014556C5C|nr:ATP-binding cassette sub-family C member 8-like [Asterias rubens]